MTQAGDRGSARVIPITLGTHTTRDGPWRGRAGHNEIHHQVAELIDLIEARRGS